MRYLLTILLLMAFALPAFAEGDEVRAGKEGHEFMGIVLHPYTAFGIDRLSGPDDWATGMKFGLEIDASEGAYVDMSLKLHDILTEDEDEVYDWDSTFSLMVGWYW
jgi:hypothetical protein